MSVSRLSSGPQDCEKFTTFLEWKVRQVLCPENRRFVPHEHFLDNCTMGGKPATNQYHDLLYCFTGVCDELGFPIAHHKTILPTTRLTYLGDTDMAYHVSQGSPRQPVIHSKFD